MPVSRLKVSQNWEWLLNPLFSATRVIGIFVCVSWWRACSIRIRIQPQVDFFIVNALEELDEPGEWYLDRKKHIVYNYPYKRDGDLNKAEVIVPRVEELIRVDGYPLQKFINIKTPFRYMRVKSTKGPGSLNFAEFGAYGHTP